MEYTKFGEEMRVLRARRHQTMKEMADVLGVTKSFLSSVETGRRSVPKDWIDIIADHYHLKEYPKSILIQAAAASRNFIRISLSGQPGYRRDLAVAFEEGFEKIDEETSEMMMTLMNKKENENDVTPCMVDKKIWLICSGNYYWHSVSIPSKKNELINKINQSK